MKKMMVAICAILLLCPSLALAQDGHQPYSDQNKLFVVDGILLVNKDHPLPTDYAPLTNEVDGLLPSARQAYDEMRQAALTEVNVPLYIQSGYRSYQTQGWLYNSYLAQAGERAKLFSAQAGYSEHQTGLACDIGDARQPAITLETAFGKTEAGQWLAKNSWRFGFILRYKDGYEEVTGYQFEPWHFRYVGKQAAQDIYKNDLTLEAYLGLSEGGDRQLAKAVASPIEFNNQVVELPSYLINHAHYYKLRDLAKLCDGTPLAFGIGYDEARKLVLISDKDKTDASAEGASIQTEPVGKVEANLKRVASKQTTNIDFKGQLIGLDAYQIDGFTYLKLRDMQERLGYQVSYRAETKTIVLSFQAKTDEQVTANEELKTIEKEEKKAATVQFFADGEEIQLTNVPVPKVHGSTPTL